jgi:flagellar biosynthesis protein FlhG
MVDLYPENKVAKAFISLADNLIDAQVDNQAQGTLQFFWKQFLGVSTEAS